MKSMFKAKRLTPYFIVSAFLLAATPHSASAALGPHWFLVPGGSGISGCNAYSSYEKRIGNNVYGYSRLDCKNGQHRNAKSIRIEQRLRRSIYTNSGYWTIRYKNGTHNGNSASQTVSQRCNNKKWHKYQTQARYAVIHHSGKVYRGNRYIQNNREIGYVNCG